MKIDFSKFFSTVAETIRRFPVEMGIAFCGFVFMALVQESVISKIELNLRLIPVFFAVALILNNLFPNGKIRRIYYLGWLLFIPLLRADLHDWTNSIAYPVTLAVCLLGILASRRTRGNESFASEAVQYAFDFIVAAAFAVVAHLLLLAIYFSVSYIFNIWEGKESGMFAYSAMTAYALALPLVFLTFTRSSVSRGILPSRIFDALLNYIVTPALLIYTAILYIYCIQIVVNWSLPKGNLAYMVFAFTMLAIVVKACQPLLERRMYDWFFGRFSLIALPPVIMFWVGTMYRVGEYGLTEDRVYLLACGLIMTLTLALFFSPKTGKYLYASVMAIALLSLFTFIPPLSAKNIAIRSQTQRVKAIARPLGLLDEQGGLNLSGAILADTAQRARYHQIYESLKYLKRHRAPLFGLNTAEDFLEVVDPSIRGYVREGRDEEGTRQDAIYVSKENAVFDIAGYTRLNPVRTYIAANTRYRYENRNDSLFVFRTDTLIWAVTTDQLLDRQLAAVGYSQESPPTEAALQERAGEFLAVRTDSFALIFSHLNLTRTKSGKLAIGYFNIDYLLTREPDSDMK